MYLLYVYFVSLSFTWFPHGQIIYADNTKVHYPYKLSAKVIRK